jgi:hypothetical protein
MMMCVKRKEARMRSLALITAAMVVLGCNATFAQQMRSTSMRNAPATGMTSTAAVPGIPMPGTIPAIGAGLGIAPGTINTGAMGQISGSPIGRITACATTGVAAAPGALFSATTADPLLGTLPPTLLPGATLPAAPPFGPSTMTGACDPTASTQAIIEALGSSVAVTIPGLATTTGIAYSDATVPFTALEAGGSGQSPDIIVPAPLNPSASPCVGNPTIPLTVVTDPATLAMNGATLPETTSSGPLSLFGC